jgi:predicted nucleic acid-binding protein
VLLEEQLVCVLSGPRQPDRKVVAEPPQLIVPAASTKRQRQVGQVGVLFAEQLCNQIRGDLIFSVRHRSNRNPEMAISAVTLAELSAGPHEARPDTEQDVYFEAAEQARRLDVLQRAEHEFDPIPFDTDAARAYGRVTAAVIAAGRKPRRRAVDLMIAATAIAAELPLYTTNPSDFVGLDRLVTVIHVTRPEVPNER